MLIELAKRLSHKLWRRLVKKERRRRVRQQFAQKRDLRIQEEQEALLADPTYVAELERIEHLEEESQRLEKLAAEQAKQEWELRDAALHSKFLREKQKRLLQEEERAKQEELIKKEWEEKQKKEKEEEDKKQEQQSALLQTAVERLGEPENGESSHNPEPPQGYGRNVVRQKGEPCPFFTKTGACRFGVQCSREHDYPDQSRTLLFPNMYSHFGLDHLALDSHDSDVALEYSESENYQHFKDFFEDTLPEFQRCGSVVQFKVCCNTSPHLRGNVYVQYTSEESALKARAMFNGRWYAGKQLNSLFINLDRWKSAMCGLFWRNKCPKGGQCNFLHAFRNPGNAFWRADQDLHLDNPRNQEGDSRFIHTHRNYDIERCSQTPSSVRSNRSMRNSHGSRSRSRSLSEERIHRKSSKRKQSPKRSSRHESKRSSHRSRESRNRYKRSRSRSAESRSRSKRSRSRSRKRSRSKSSESRNRSKRSRSRSKRSRSRSAESRNQSNGSRSSSRQPTGKSRKKSRSKNKSKRSRSRSADPINRVKKSRSRSKSVEMNS